jgi:2-dehydro-3-deoxyphosphogluconate aldolase / (4S)-4-hydroxy-2-oxoglutarate aldolase
MEKQVVFQGLKEAGIVAIMRNMDPTRVVETVAALQRAGVSAVEITVEQESGLACIARLKEAFPTGLWLGAGTVLDAAKAEAAIAAGAQYLITPALRPEVIKVAQQHGVLSAIGAMTPTEVLTAYELGADLVKVFPAESLGPSYLKHLRGPLPHIPTMPTGGIGVEQVAAYLQQGAVCVGVGSALYNYQTAAEIEQAAQRFVAAVRDA